MTEKKARVLGETEEAEGRVALFEEAGALESADTFGQGKFVVMLEDDQRVRRKKAG